MKEKKKINFFKRLKIAIFNLDEYDVFIEEKLSVAIKYMLLIIIFSSIFLSIITTLGFSKELKKGLDYFKNEFPDFSFDGTTLRLPEYVEGYDKDYDVKIIADSTENLDKTKINEYINTSKEASTALIVLSDKIIYRNHDLQNEYSYKYLNSAFNIKDSNKTKIIEEYNSLGGENLIITTGMIITSIVLIIENLIEIIAHTLLVAMIGIIVGRICGIAMKGSVAGSLAIYSLTVPVLCKVVYSIVYSYTNFEIKYFNVMYLMIAYVYIIAAILIIKTDLNKQSQEFMRIKSVEEQIKDEMKRKELEENQNQEKEDEEEKDDEKGDNKKDNPEPKIKEPNIEPDGSEI